MRNALMADPKIAALAMDRWMERVNKRKQQLGPVLVSERMLLGAVHFANLRGLAGVSGYPFQMSVCVRGSRGVPFVSLQSHRKKGTLGKGRPRSRIGRRESFRGL